MIFIINAEKAEFLDNACKVGQRYLIGPFNSFTYLIVFTVYLDNRVMFSYVINLISTTLSSTPVGVHQSEACLLIVYKTGFYFFERLWVLKTWNTKDAFGLGF